ncbi:ATP-binding cassette sub-family A member 2 isoform X2 [Drosophila ficusphila]|uniref:ATP-binding cassette sub-family A member 2 isoform X2 n=1 Tax=Drosophila ficusphila TaxID=30025 RepID=UPI0007E83934|nr:ATP-binding cassette sub-family A member 2 isoform X2 [Drosophila ficusphila]
MAERKGPNFLVQLLLLVWKNFLLIFDQKCYMVSLFIIFAILPVLLMCLRLFPSIGDKPETEGVIPVQFYLESLPRNIYYAPHTKFLESMLGIFNTSNITGFQNADKLKDALISFADPGSSVLGIEFRKSWNEWPDELSFAIRIPKNWKGKVQPLFAFFGTNLIYFNGYMGVQKALSEAHIQQKCKEMNKDIERAKFPEFKDLPSPLIYDNGFAPFIKLLAELMIIIVTYFIVVSLTKSIVEEKVLQLKETLALLGVCSGLQWLAWYIQNFIILLIGFVLITICWKVVLPEETTLIAFVPFTHWSVLLFILMVLGHCMICFSFLLSSLISTKRRVALIATLSLFATTLPYYFLYSEDNRMAMDTLISVFLLSGLMLLSKLAGSWEDYGVGVQWDNLFQTAWPGDSVSIGYVLLVMILCSIVCVLICLYVEQIRPGPYGVARPWHFPVTFCCRNPQALLPYRRLFRRLFGIREASTLDVERLDDELMEPDPEGKTAGVQIMGLSKNFGRLEAVRGVSFDMFEDQVTVLMGHNGAGKTTLISMLAGFIMPTSGTALVNGYDIQKQRYKARRCIGLCPQQNVLFRNMGSANHIEFFSRLRGLRGAEVKAEVEKYLEKLNLESNRRAPVRNLSGGTQRRLSVACALCGGVKVLICDEPGTGLDPSSRRDLWKLILESKEGCTIMLTSHELEDAEVLCDRMVIISEGTLRCIGSMPFLKNLVDASCLLTCETRKRCEVDKLSALISSHVGTITPYSTKGRDVCYKLPLKKSKSFSALFRDLERKRDDLGVRGFGISSVSLEEIFMTFGAEDLQAPRKDGGADKNQDDDDESFESDDEDKNVHKCCYQWGALGTKKFLFLYDYKVYFLVLLLVPLFYFLLMLLRIDKSEDLIRLDMNFGVYDRYDVSALLSDPGNSTGIRPTPYTLSRVIGDDIEIKETSLTVDEYLEEASKTKEGRREIVFMPFAVSVQTPLVGWVGPRHFVHARPMTLNLLYNVLAHEFLGPQINLEVVTAPFKEDIFIDKDNSAKKLNVYIYICIALILFSSMIIVERDSHMKMQQEVSGLSMISYWLTNLLIDMMVYLILVLVLILPLYKSAHWEQLLLVLLLMGLTGLIFCYFMILVFSASVLIVSLVLLSGFFLATILSIFGTMAIYIPDLRTYVYVIVYVANLHPMVAGYLSLAKCFSHFYVCSPGYIESEGEREINCVNPFANSVKHCVCEYLIIWPEIICLIVGAILFSIIIVLFEYGGCLWYALKDCCPVQRKSNINDPKVLKEAEKIKSMNSDQIGSRALVVAEVSKNYCCGPLAVNNISFVVKPFYCVGLLGPNGAGKTSTFKMIVGEHSIDGGNIYISGYSMKKNRKSALKEIGYCPQFDSLFEFYTGRQMVKFFLMLRGTKSDILKERCEQLADQFGFTKHLDKKIKYYSDGTKRKITAAIACRAKSLICLDEPNSGVDPASRLRVWTLISEEASTGKAVLLTSHSMDEVNALCSKCVILVDGSIYAMGSNQHVKNKIARGMVLKLTINANTQDMADVLLKIENELVKKFPDATIKEIYEFSGRLTFHIPDDNSSWSQMFEFVEGKRGSWHLADYSLSQPSMEEVFMEIAEERKQNTQKSKSVNNTPK